MNVRSRVQMKLYEAKMKARKEIATLLDKEGVTIEQVREYTSSHPKYRKAMRKYGEKHGVSTAINFVGELAGKVR